MEHDKKVAAIQKVLSKTQNACLSYGRTNTLHTRDYKRKRNQIDLSCFNQIISIDIKNHTATVEPRVTMETLTKATLAHGLIPLVVPEFKTITVGGAISGGALESSSFKHGQFNDTVLEMELLLGDGTKVMASPKNHTELFYATCGSMGSLALLTQATIQLRKSAPFVTLKVENDPAFSPKRGDFHEGLFVSPQILYSISGTLAETPSAPLFTTKRSWSLWYYQYILKQGAHTFCMPLYDYLFRHDRGAFWMGRYLRKPTFINRLLFGWSMTSARLYKGWHTVLKQKANKLFFVHDFYIPKENLEKTLLSFYKEANISPFWLCPILGTQTPQLFSPHLGHEMFVNVGIYGRTLGDDFAKKMEKIAFINEGRKMLYSPWHSSREGFSTIYDLETYKNLRHKYKADRAFVSIIEKMSL